MFEISELKAKKLPELQEVAKSLNISKFRSLKKLDLVYKILDYQAANPDKVKKTQDKPTSPEADDKKAQAQKQSGRRNTPQSNKPSDQNKGQYDTWSKHAWFLITEFYTGRIIRHGDVPFNYVNQPKQFWSTEL